MLDPSGHRCHGLDGVVPTAEHLDQTRWSDCVPYLVGCDLYNHGYWWEAHEAWETLWHAARRRRSVQADYLRGLIQVSASALKYEMQNARGAARLLGRADQLLRHVVVTVGAVRYMGLDVDGWLAALERYYEPRFSGVRTIGHDPVAFPFIVLDGIRQRD